MKWFSVVHTLASILFPSGNQHGSTLVDQLQEQENVLQQCVGQLESAETTRIALVSQLKEALLDQVSSATILFSQAYNYNAKFHYFCYLLI